MGWCLAPPLRDHGEHRAMTSIHRFDPRFWTVDFPRPMMASVVSTAADALRVDLAFTGRGGLAGLIWESQDRHDHPLIAYATRRDYRTTTLSFRWRSSGIKPLDAVNGPTLTIEGHDETGAPRTWYVRLWNYALGTAEDAVITLDFAALAGGFLLPAEADPVWAGAIDRLFISLVPPDYDGTPGDYASMADAWVELTDIRCTGSGAVLPIGDAMLPANGLSIATAYDDSYHLTPQRVLRMVQALGYDGSLLHYVGMSHYPRLARSGGDWQASVVGGALCEPARAWHAALADGAAALGWRVIWSLSYELLAQYCPPDWAQRTSGGAMALTGWQPPSTVLSPANGAAMGYLAHVARAFVVLAGGAGLPIDFQIGEPWWWITPAREICTSDAAAAAILGPLSAPVTDVGAPLSAAQEQMLDAAGGILSASTAALAAAVRDEAGTAGARLHLLIYLPTILNPAWPQVRRANMPLGWAQPAFDVLQIEDYDWAARGQSGATAHAIAETEARLGYSTAQQHYVAGFVLHAQDRAQWAAISAAATTAARRGVATRFIWALPQVARDGFLHFPEGEDSIMQAFDDVDFPLAIGAHASVLAEFSTAIVTGQSGSEQRAPDWENARLRFDAGPGIRAEGDIATLIRFFRARRGPAIGFRFRDPFDHSSAADGGSPSATDQQIGVGDGIATQFALVKIYGEGNVEPDAPRRRITRPVAASCQISIDGSIVTSGWQLLAGGIISFAIAPPAGAVIRAGFLFDVPVRFAEDRIEASLATFRAGEIPSVPLIEVREA